MRKPVLLYVNNKGADQPAYLRSLISTFVIRCLDSIISVVAICKISRLLLVSKAEQASLGLTWSQTLKTGFLVTRLKLSMTYKQLVVLNFHLFWQFLNYDCSKVLVFTETVKQIRGVFGDNLGIIFLISP